jgi:hypothetical protein
MKCFALLLFLILSTQAHSTPTPTPLPAPDHYGGALYQDSNGFLDFSKKPGADVDTLNMIDQQNRINDSGNRNASALFGSIAGGKGRAQQMIHALKTEELKKALIKVTGKGNAILQENAGLRSPIAIVSGVLSFWVGNAVRLVNDENFRVTTRVDGRNKTGEFMLESPLLNSKVKFKDNDGVSVNVGRSLPVLNSKAELNYNSKTQAVSTQVSHPLAPHLDFSVGTNQIPELNNQTDGRAKIEYKINF